MSKTGNPRVMIFDASYDNSMDEIIENILTEFPMDWKGKKILVKPNILSPTVPERAATTNPAVVSSVVRRLLSKGASVKVGDNPGMIGYGISFKSAKVTGIIDAADGCFTKLSRNPIRYEIKSKYFDHLMISQDILDADIVINLPKLKTHGLTFYTGAVKNTFGYVVGGYKTRVHSLAKTPREFAEALIDIYQIRPPDLNIMDAVEAMEGNGPSNGTPRKLGKILASDNAVTLDTAAIHLIGQKIKSVPHISLAGKRGLGTTDFSLIKVEGPFEPVKNFKMPSTFLPGITGVVLNRLLARWINSVPEIIHDRCQKCAICIQHCPVKAMKMGSDGFPAADRHSCINCYCCQELCPENAILLSGRLLKVIRRTYVR